jgi:hypothetical protein
MDTPLMLLLAGLNLLIVSLVGLVWSLVLWVREYGWLASFSMASLRQPWPSRSWRLMVGGACLALAGCAIAGLGVEMIKLFWPYDRIAILGAEVLLMGLLVSMTAGAPSGQLTRLGERPSPYSTTKAPPL